jgi:hypothetical protein
MCLATSVLMSRSSAWPLLLRVVVALLVSCSSLLLTAEARAAPRVASDEDLVAEGDGELDPDDLVGRATVGRGTARSSPGGQAWVSLAGFSRETMAGQREIGGLVVVGLPLDRFARVAARAGLYTKPTALPITNVVASGTGGASANVVVGAQPDDPPTPVTPRLARAAVEAAWRTAGLGNDDARLDSIVARARWSGVLPETRLRAIRYDAQTLYAESSVDTNRLRDSAGANVGLEARLTWRFDRLLYAEDEPTFERMRLERHDARARIAGRVLEALFHWHRAWLELRWAQAASRDAREPPNRPSRDEAESALRVMEAEATLDVLTAGWFTASRARFAVTKAIGPVPSALPEAL